MPALTRRRLRTHFANVDSVIAALIDAAGPYRLRAVTCPSPFRHLTQAIISQQISGRAAATIIGRFVALFGMDVADKEFPAPMSILAMDEPTLRSVGLSASKVATVRDLATKTVVGLVPDSDTLQRLSDQQIIKRLTVVRGVGAWTVQMMLMFHLGREDVLPINDYGIRNGFAIAYRRCALPTPGELQRFGERWAPYRSAAAWYLWRAIDLRKTDGTVLKTLPAAPRGDGARRRLRRGARTR